MKKMGLKQNTAALAVTLVKSIRIISKKRQQHTERKRSKTLHWKEKHQYSSICYLDKRNKRTVYGRICVSATGKLSYIGEASDIVFKITLNKNKQPDIFFEASQTLLSQVGLEFVFKIIENAVKELSKKTKQEFNRIKDQKKLEINRSNWKGYYLRRAKRANAKEIFDEAIKCKVYSKTMALDCLKNDFSLEKIPKSLSVE